MTATLVNPHVQPEITADSILSMPMTAFFWHPDFNCYVIERGAILELLDF